MKIDPKVQAVLSTTLRPLQEQTYAPSKLAAILDRMETEPDDETETETTERPRWDPEAIRSLRPFDRLVLAGAYFSNMTDAEMASLLHVARETCARSLRRSREVLGMELRRSSSARTAARAVMAGSTENPAGSSANRAAGSRTSQRATSASRTS